MYDVLFYTPWSGPLYRERGGDSLPSGGAETQIHLLAQALARRGLRVGVVVYDIPEDLPSRHCGVDVIVRPPYSGGGGPIDRLKEIGQILIALARRPSKCVVKRTAGIDVGIVAVIARALGRKFVFSSANIVDFDYSLLTTGRDRFLYRLGVRLANTIVVQTDEQAAMCRDTFHRDATTIRSLAEDVTGYSAGRDAFVWIGRLVDYKRPLEFIALARSIPEARFVMVGVPVPHEGLEKLHKAVLDAASTVSNLEILDPMPRTELASVIERAVAIVSTSVFEGMPNVFLEAWSRGIPTLALSHDPDQIIQRECLGGCAHGSSEILRDLAIDMWRNRTDCNELAQRCRDYIQCHHSPDVVASAWIKALGLQSNDLGDDHLPRPVSACVG